MAETIKGASLNPDSFGVGGLPDDIDIIFTKFRYVDDFDYNGAIQSPILAAKLDYVTRDGDTGTQHYSAGDLKRLIPSGDGKRAIPVAGKDSATIIQSSNLAQLVLSLVNCGYPKDQLTDDLSQFEGMGVHVRRVPQVKKAGLKPKEDTGKEQQVLVVSEILWMPTEAPKFKPGTGVGRSKSVGGPPKSTVVTGPTPGAASASESTDGALDSKTAGYIVQLLAANGGKVLRSTLPASLFTLCQTDPNCSEILVQAYKPSWLAAAGRPFKFNADSDAVSIG